MTRSEHVDGLLVQHAAPPSGVTPRRPPLLLVHGSGHGAWCWEHWLERLPQLGWEAYALSLRNHPGSRSVDAETYCRRTTVDDYADDVAAAAAFVGRPCVVVGHSMGGIVAQRFAARSLAAGAAAGPAAKGGAAGIATGSRALVALVLLASVPPGQLGPLRPAPLPTERPHMLAREVARARYFQTAATDVVERALDRLVPESPSVLNQYSLGAGMPVAPGEITVPVLSVTAGQDRSVTPRDDRIGAYYGGDWLHDAASGHDVMLELGWSALLDRIVAWLHTHAVQG